MPDYWIQKTSTIFSQPDHGKDFKLEHIFWCHNFHDNTEVGSFIINYT